MHKSPDQLPLFVDLDGTLIKSDVGLESVLILLRRNIFYLLLLPLWALGGLSGLKRRIASRVELAAATLPLNPELYDYLQSEHKSGRSITLISASDERLVRKVGGHIGLFDRSVGTSGPVNLRGRKKLEKIRSLCDGEFAYAGNARADIPVWRAAAEILAVNCSAGLTDRVKNHNAIVRYFDAPAPILPALFRAMRPHQWLKNGLLFLPLILSHQANRPDMLLQCLIGMVSFSLCASSVYLCNDLLDLEADRRHRNKKGRPLACGELPLRWALLTTPGLLFGAFLTASILGAEFVLVLSVYWLITCMYSVGLKRLFLVDTLILALLYTLRIAAGSAAIGVITTNWLLAFSMSLFLGLALLKRFTELNSLKAEGLDAIPGRAYRVAHRTMLAVLGAAAGLLAIGVLAVYINAAETTALYSRPQVLWGISPLLLFLLCRIWYFAHRGRLHEDPVLFAIEDRPSQFALLCSGLLIWLAI